MPKCNKYRNELNFDDCRQDTEGKILSGNDGGANSQIISSIASGVMKNVMGLVTSLINTFPS